ncbi:MAG: Hsp20/alpha crystallin family protein [Betaproteobacteria bacterium]
MNQMTTFDPFADAGFDELFRGFFRPVRAAAQPQAVAIKVDVKATAQGYVVIADIPGVKKEDIQVTIEGKQVTLAAEVKRETEQKEGDRVLRTERYSGHLYRSFTLPVELDEDASSAKYENGVLELALARKQAVAGRKLTIQ